MRCTSHVVRRGCYSGPARKPCAISWSLGFRHGDLGFRREDRQMKPGRLRVLLGAAPGVGKTYEMLEEGRRLRDSGRDVAIGLLETHDRAATAALAEGLPIVPRREVAHRGVELTEMDVDAVLERHPELALVDELAHANAPGSRNP